MYRYPKLSKKDTKEDTDEYKSAVNDHAEPTVNCETRGHRCPRRIKTGKPGRPHK